MSDSEEAVKAKAAKAKAAAAAVPTAPAARCRKAESRHTQADAVLAALQRRANPRSPASSGGPASAHSSPSLQPDELSDGYNSEAEQDFNTASPLGVMDWQEDEDDDGEAAFAARLNAHDGMLPAYDDINGGPQNVLDDDGVEPEAAEPRQPGEAAEPEAAELGEPGEAAVPEAEPPAATPAAPDPSKPPKLESKTALLKASARAWPTAVFVLLSVESNGLPSAPRMLSLGAEVADPHALLTGSMSESFHQYVRLPDGDTVNHDRTRVIHGCTFEELQRRACGSVAEIGQNWLDWLEQVMSRAPQSTPFVLATWNGYKTGAYSLLCT